MSTQQMLNNKLLLMLQLSTKALVSYWIKHIIYCFWLSLGTVSYLLSKGARLTAKEYDTNLLHLMVSAIPTPSFQPVMELFEVIATNEDAKVLAKLQDRIFGLF